MNSVSSHSKNLIISYIFFPISFVGRCTRTREAFVHWPKSTSRSKAGLTGIDQCNDMIAVRLSASADVEQTSSQWTTCVHSRRKMKQSKLDQEGKDFQACTPNPGYWLWTMIFGANRLQTETTRRWIPVFTAPAFPSSARCFSHQVLKIQSCCFRIINNILAGNLVISHMMYFFMLHTLFKREILRIHLNFARLRRVHFPHFVPSTIPHPQRQSNSS